MTRAGTAGPSRSAPASPESLGEVTGIISAIVIGLLIGALGRLVVPGRQKIRLWVTLLIGVAAAIIGTFLAAALGVAETGGVDWIELALQVGLAAAGVAVIAGTGGRSRR